MTCIEQTITTRRDAFGNLLMTPIVTTHWQWTCWDKAFCILDQWVNDGKVDCGEDDTSDEGTSGHRSPNFHIIFFYYFSFYQT